MKGIKFANRISGVPPLCPRPPDKRYISKAKHVLACLAFAIAVLLLGPAESLWAATVPPGFSETVIPGPSGGNWNEAVGVCFGSNGRMYVWERGGRIWIKDPADASFSLLLDISDEVGNWGDHGFLGFTLDPNFVVNGRIYLLYAVDRYHLLNFGTPGYNPTSNDYNSATIGRLTRYTCRASDNFRSVDPASRFILVGETKTTGFPLCSSSHGVGTLVFGTDGTLLVSSGDGASAYTTDSGGPAFNSYAPQAVSDGILRPKEDIGAFRSQLLDCLSGKVIRIDPNTGDGISSNPYFDPANPHSARSRVWTLGLRNPFRMTLRPGSGSHDPAVGDPGTLYVGIVGWDAWESLNVVTGPRQNFGWPIYEGLDFQPSYGPTIVQNLDAPNPLYPASGCSHYFSFDQLLHEDSLSSSAQPPFVNPCNTSQRIPTSIPQFLRTRSALDWNHANAITRTPTYGTSGQATLANIGSSGSPVSGTQFNGNCAVGGVWYTGTTFPAAYQNSYFLADWGQGWIKNMTFDSTDKPVAVYDFLSAGGQIVCLFDHPSDGSLYYIAYNYGAPGTIRKIAYVGNRSPIAAASADRYYGPTPLALQFSSSGSIDPDNQPVTFSWNFGDGSPASTQANPAHSFSAPAGVPTKFIVTLTVTDSGGLSSQTNLIVSVNNTPPNVTITRPVDGSLYNPNVQTTNILTASVSDAESSDAQLTYLWQTVLHHNDHNHGEGTTTNHVTSDIFVPTGCDGINIFYYRVILTVTDPAGLSTVSEVRVFPDCGPNTAPTISDIANQSTFQDRALGPIPFAIGDREMAPQNLQLSAVSANTALVPTANIVFGGSGSNRTVTVVPAPGQVGTATITVSVTDGPLTSSDTFVVTVNPAAIGTASFTNSFTITIPDSGASTPYPSYAAVSGLGGTISNVTVTFTGMTHTWTPDLDILLAAPSGQAVLVMSDAGSGGVNNLNLTLSDLAAGLLPQTPLTSGTYKPANYPPADTFPAPAPASWGNALSAFNGLTANGNWALYVFDDGPGDLGSINLWSVKVATTKASGAPPTITMISDQTTSVTTPTAAIPFTVADPDTALASLTLSGSSSNPSLVPNSNISFGGSGGSRTVTITPAAGQVGTATITVTVNDGSSTASAGFVMTVVGVNTPPTISSIADQVTNEDTPVGPIAFTVGDGETPTGSLTLSAASSNPTLLPPANVVFGGSGANRTATLTPATNQNGTASITIIVSDGSLTASNTFLLTVNAVNDPPSISGIPNQTISQDTSTGPISFTVSDPETAASSLGVTGSSSNQTLVANGNIVFGGSGTNRTVTISPSAGQLGTTLITLSVSDGSLNSTTSFLVTVTPPNTPPTISGLSDQIINEDTPTGALPFTVGDSFTPPASLTLSATSSNPGLAPVSNIVFGGSGTNRTVTVTPATNQNGTTTIAVIVSDGSLTATNSFVLTVNPVNDPPTISSVANRTISVGTSTGPISFTVGDVETAATSLTVQGTSSNQPLVPDANVVLGGSGSNRTVTVTPASGQSGTATMTLKVSDGSLSASASFVLTVNTLFTGTASFTNGTLITIPDSGAGTPYPSSITVSNMGGTVTNLTVTLNNLSHTWTRDIDVLLVGPAGQTVMVMSDAGSGGANNVTLTFSDAAASAVPLTQLTSGTFRPTNYTDTSPGGDNFPTPAPVGPYGAALSAFNGQTANGTWALYVFDDGPGDQGSFAGGWTLTLTTVSATGGAAPTISAIANQSTTVNTPTPAIPFTINDADTPVASLTLAGNSSNTALVPNANIVFGGSGTNRTVTVTPASGQTGTATITVSVSDGGSTATSPFILTVNGVNTPPTISSIADQTTNEDTAVGPLALTVGDAQTPPGSLTLSGSSTNPTLVPNGNIVFGGSGANRTVTIIPATNQNGTATITLIVSDGSLTATNTFLLTVNPVNDPPTISSIGNQSVSQDTVAGPIAFTIGDVETPAASLIVSGNSSNQTLVADANIVFGGSGSNRTVTITPASGQTGTATISITVSDGLATAMASFVLTVTPPNTPPTISGLSDQIINEDTPTGALPFTVGDSFTPPASLTLSATSSNPSLAPVSNIVFGGSGANRTVTITPATNQNGTAIIAVIVSDGSLTATNSFVLTVNPVNDPPTISSVANRTISVGTSTGPISFTVGDVETAATSLTVQGTSSNQPLVPDANVVLGGSGSNRTVTVTPASGQSGTATITLKVSDGSLSASTSFVLTVSTLFTGTASFTNGTLITIPDSGAGTPYPSSITVSNMGGTVTNLTVTLRSMNHTWAADIDILLVGPGGQQVLIFSDVGGGYGLNNVTVTLSDAAASALPASGQIVSGTFKPTNIGAGDTFAAPAPAGPYLATLSAFNGLSANGAWFLYVFDDGPGDLGSVGGGWYLTIKTTATGPALTIPEIPIEPAGANPITVSIGTVDQFGHVTLQVNGSPWEKYVIEASEDLNTWLPVGIVYNETGVSLFTEDGLARKGRFYRVSNRP